MQPYQEADQSTRKSGELPLNAIKYGAGLAIGAGGSMVAKNLIGKIVPLLNSFIPESFAKKALGKIDPRLGNLVKKAEGEGIEFNEVKDFLKDKIDKTMNKESSKEKRNIIEQYSPELNQFMTEMIGSGEDPLRAAAAAIFDKKKNFESIIRKMEKDHKTPWTAIVDSIYGGKGAQNTQNTQNQQQTGPGQQQPSEGLDAQVAQIIQQGNEIIRQRRGM